MLGRTIWIFHYTKVKWTLKKYFDLEDIEADKKVKIAKAKLRGTALTWWTSVQKEREERGLNKISDWDMMKTMVRSQFLPSYLAIQINMTRNNLKQRDMDVMTYIEQFHTDNTHISARNQTVTVHEAMTANKVMTAKGVMVGKIWCPMVLKMNKEVNKAMKSTEQG